ncbi:MAG: carboxypeptidase M32 [Chloroflexota bacterium]|nr:carboxypeptidase M32 [Chloroflexota bacterium]
MEPKLYELKTRLLEISDLESAAALLSWDQSTYMPAGGAEARARQLATLGLIAHEKAIDPAIGNLLEDLKSYETSLPEDSDDACLISIARHDYEKAIKVPPLFTAQMYAHASQTYDVWSKARPANDFASVLPYLEKTLELSRQFAEFFPGYEHVADPLIDFADRGLKTTEVQSIFANLRSHLVPIVESITAAPVADDSCLRRCFPEEKQLAFGTEVIKRLGYDFERGRCDKTPHPFTTKFSLGDVRITTRVRKDYLGEALFSTIHEAGHALYEQGIHSDYDGTPLGSGTSMSVHESQSRLWENIVGCSRWFWSYFYPEIQRIFHDQLGSVSFETFYRAINKVERSFIRTDADEVTYNLHVMMRFDLELDLLEGRLAVRDLPEAWRERFKADLGIMPPDDRDGVLQDIHWFAGVIGGAFQGYSLGNVLGAQFFAAALKARPEICGEIEQGGFDTLRNWLTENVYRHGRKYTTTELVKRVTGGPMSIEPYIQRLRDKYGELYSL